jgi:uncharacterized protein involved in tellurium resistance
MTDREMLELIAKAMGYDDAEWTAKYGCIVTAKINGSRCFWNPLTDDGDCFRMESALKIDIDWGVVDVMSKSYGDYHEEPYANHNGDKNAARRKASCMVAAMIGREMP